MQNPPSSQLHTSLLDPVESWLTYKVWAVVSELLRQRGEPEVGELEVLILVEDEILGLQVAVGDSSAVAEIDGREEKRIRRLRFRA